MILDDPLLVFESGADYLNNHEHGDR